MATQVAPHGVNGTSSVFNDWPNDAGFDVFEEEKEPMEMKVSGKIPAYAAGVLYRTGPGGRQVETNKNKSKVYNVDHWFDGFAQTHRFELLPPADGKHVTNVKYNSRHTSNGLIEEARKNGKLSGINFGQRQDPCESYFRKVISSFFAARTPDNKGVEDYNIGVTVHPNMPLPGSAPNTKTSDATASSIENIWLKTDAANLQRVNPTTLEPREISSNKKIHPDLKGAFTGAHSPTDPITGDWYNYNLETGRTPVYRIFKVSAKTGEASILATLSGPKIRPAYLHSIMMTENYVIVCIFNSYYIKNGLQVLWARNLVDAMESDPNSKNTWLVVDRVHGRGLVGIYESPPFFAFHPVNAWEVPSATSSEKGAIDIHTDIPTYPNLDVLQRSYYNNMSATSPSARAYTTQGEKGTTSRTTLTRFCLPELSPSTPTIALSPTTPPPAEAIKETKTLFTAPSDASPELPTINPSLHTRPSRYIYGVADRGHSTFVDGLVKYDAETNSAMHWHEHAQSPGEPIFVAEPEGKGEDKGVLLSVVLDGNEGKSYLLCLDARTMQEVGRAGMEGVVGFGFHGTYVPGSKV
ncbi:hypothetical protein ACLMJK_008195 [Lecanora helva]